VWRPRRGAPEIAGDLLLAHNNDGRTLVQFIKTPFPILTGQTTPSRWQIEFPPEHRFYSGAGPPPARLIWLHLATCLYAHAPPPKGWIFERNSSEPPQPMRSDARPGAAQGTGAGIRWRFENKITGETLEGFFSLPPHAGSH